MSGLELGRLNLRSAVRPMFGGSGSYQRLDQGGGSPASSSDEVRLPEGGLPGVCSRTCCACTLLIVTAVVLAASVVSGVRWSNAHHAAKHPEEVYGAAPRAKAPYAKPRAPTAVAVVARPSSRPSSRRRPPP